VEPAADAESADWWSQQLTPDNFASADWWSQQLMPSQLTGGASS